MICHLQARDDRKTGSIMRTEELMVCPVQGQKTKVPTQIVKQS